MLATAFGAAPRSLFNSSVSGAAPPAPGTTAAGCCGVTKDVFDCSGAHGPKGSWNTTTQRIPNLAACVARCEWANCSSCNFVSFSLENEDCSWYASCDLSNLLPLPIYESEAVSPGRAPPLPDAQLYSLAIELPGASGGGGAARRVLLLVSKTEDALAVSLAGGGFPAGATALVLEGAGPEPGFNVPESRQPDAGGVLQLGSYAVALVELS